MLKWSCGLSNVLRIQISQCKMIYKIEVKFSLSKPIRKIMGVEVKFHSFLTSTRGCGKWSRNDRFTSRNNPRVHWTEGWVCRRSGKEFLEKKKALFPAGRLTSHRLPHLLAYLLPPWSRVLFEKLTGLQLVKKFPAFYGTQMFITAVTSFRHLSLSWASSIQSRLTLWPFRHMIRFYSEGLLGPRQPHAGGPPLVGCARLLIQYTRNYPPYWRPFLHPQPQDAPCRGDRDPPITIRRLARGIFTTPSQLSRGIKWLI